MKIPDIRPVFVPLLRLVVRHCRDCKAPAPDHLVNCRRAGEALTTGARAVNGKDTGIRTMPGTTAPSLPAGWKPYVYRGTGEDVLTPRMKGGPKPRPKPEPKPEPEPLPELQPEPEPELLPAQDEARLRVLEEQLAGREVIDTAQQPAEPEPGPAAKPARRCRRCKYLTTSASHRVICGSGS